MRICQRCVMDITDPDIKFDERGVCNHCIEYGLKEKLRRVEAGNLPWIYEKIRKNGINKKYDCLLGLSGGVDSSLVLHYLLENGIRPLCYSVDNGWNTVESDENIMRLVEGLKVPFFRYTIDLDKFKELQIAFIKSGTSNIEIPTDHLLMATSYEMARKNNIKYIISGGNLATEGIMPIAWGYQARDKKFIESVYEKTYSKKINGLPLMSLVSYLFHRFLKGIRVINLLDYYEYDRSKAKKLLNEKYGWKDYGEKHEESKFTKWFQDTWLSQFGIDKRKAHYSSMINSKQMTRNQAIELLSKPLIATPCPIVYSPSEFNIEMKSYQDYPNSEYWWNMLSRIYATIK